MTSERRGILTVHSCGLPLDEKNKSTPIFLLISGWPDQPDTFDEFTEPFESKCHVVKMCYPEMDSEELSRFWGYSPNEVCLALANVVNHPSYEGHPIYVLGFDWGSVPVYQLAHRFPDLVDKIILQDVGILNLAKVPPYTIFVVASYQSFLAFIFLLSRLLGKTLSAKLLTPLIFLFPWSMLMPLSPAFKETASSIKPHMCYPYLQALMNLTKIGGRLAVPTFYAYGEKKEVMFHDDGFIKALEKREGCSSKGYEQGTHWIHKECKEGYQKDVMEFLGL